MGAFQGVAAGLGEAGEQAGQGINNALNEALKVRSQLFDEQIQSGELSLRQAQLQQTYDLAQQQHELARQQLLAQGWTHTGTVKGTDGRYYQQFDNPRMPLGQQTTRIPYAGEAGGVPPDSMEAMLDNYKRLKEQGFEDTRAQQLAFKAVNLYRTDPAGLVSEYAKYAKELNEEKGVTKVPVFGFGNIDISDESGQAKYAQAMIDSGRGMAPLLRAMMGYGPGATRDMTGWTANEQREYRAEEVKQKNLEAAYEKLLAAQMNSPAAFDPAKLEEMSKQYLERIGSTTSALDDKAAEINGRHGRTGPGGSPKKGAYLVGNVWYDATTHQPIPVAPGQ